MAGSPRELLSRYVRTSGPDTSAIAEGLWVLPPDVLSSGDRAVLFEQYQLHVEQTERLGVRRTVTSGFFLLLNTALVALATLVVLRPPDSPALLAVPLVAVLAQCLAWFWQIRSYRQLAAAKYAVVGQLEKQLPASPGVAEWTALGLGRDSARYLPLSNIESWVPLVFALCYVADFVLLLVNHRW